MVDVGTISEASKIKHLVSSFLSARGIYCSSGSACSSKSIDPSHVLLAMGLNVGEANSSIRLSISKDTTTEEVNFVVKELKKVIEKLRKISPL